MTGEDINNLFLKLKANEEEVYGSIKASRTSLNTDRRQQMEAETAWMEQELLSGKILVIPQSLYDIGIVALRDVGVYEEALENIHKSTYLRSK